MSPSTRLVLFAVLALSFAQPLSAQDKVVLATLQALDAEVGTLTVTLPPMNQRKTFSLLKKDLPVTDPLGNPLKLADLKQHHRLAMTAAKDEDIVGAIRLESDLDWGLVKSVDVDRAEIVASFAYATRPLKIGPDARLWQDGQPATLKDLKAQAIKVLLTPDRASVRQIWFGKGIYHGNPYTRATHVAGFLVTVDPVKKRMALTSLDRYKDMELDYDAWTHLRLVYSSYVLRHAAVQQLRAPCKVSLYYDSDRKRVASLSAEVPQISRRHVGKIDHVGRKLTLASVEDSAPEEFVIAADALILRGGKPCALREVREKGLVTLGLSLDQREILFLAVLEK